MSGPWPDVDRARLTALARVARVFAGVGSGPDALTAWTEALPLLVTSLQAAGDMAAEAVEDHLAQAVAESVGLGGWDFDGLVERPDPNRLASGLGVTTRRLASVTAPGGRELVLADARTWTDAVASTLPHKTAREGINTAVGATPLWSRWRWVPEPGACRWCRMQGTRGAIFVTRATAEAAGSAPHRAPTAHQHCRCHAVEVTDRAEARRLRREGQAEWERMKAEKAMKAGKPAPPAAKVWDAGQRTPERLLTVRQQIATYERTLAGTLGDPARQWQTARLAELRTELAQLAAAGIA